MDTSAQDAIHTIRQCIDAGRFEVKSHFTMRMDQRGIVWSDVLAVLDEPSNVRGDGLDDLKRERWIAEGKAGDGLPLELVCVIDHDEAAALVVFITIYWRV